MSVAARVALTAKHKEGVMSKSLSIGRAVATVLLVGVSLAATAASVGVVVSGGAVAASPAGVTLAATDDALVFQLRTAGYTFPASGAVVITGTGSAFRCTTAANKTTVTCKKTGQGNGSQQTYQINVLAAGSSSAMSSPPDIWIQSD
jgi:hypothetical protein